MEDYILNGQPHGAGTNALLGAIQQPWLYRPWADDRGRVFVDVPTGERKPRLDKGGSPVTNRRGDAVTDPVYDAVAVKDLDRPLPVNNATAMPREFWRRVDTEVREASLPVMRAWMDLAAASRLPVGDAYATLLYEYETLSDAGEAVVGMDMLPEARNFEPSYQLEGTPLPITYAEWHMRARLLAVARARGTQPDLIRARQAARKIAEKVEKTTIGVITGITYGTTADYGRAPTVYGYGTFPSRNTKTNMTQPTGAIGPTVLSSWLALRELLHRDNHRGPFKVYVSSDYDVYLDNLFSTTEPSAGTLRSRLLQIEGISSIESLEFLTGTYRVLMVEMNPDTAAAIVGRDITTTQWDDRGGELLMFRSHAILAPVLRADYDGRCGIADGTIS
jgi:hypothetical protein